MHFRHQTKSGDNWGDLKIDVVRLVKHTTKLKNAFRAKLKKKLDLVTEIPYWATLKWKHPDKIFLSICYFRPFSELGLANCIAWSFSLHLGMRYEHRASTEINRMCLLFREWTWNLFMTQLFLFVTTAQSFGNDGKKEIDRMLQSLFWIC